MHEAISEYKENQPTRVSKVYFLIHPGFAADPNTLQKNKDERRYSFDIFNQSKYNQAMKKYISVAKGMKPEEIMIAFLHKKSGALKDSIKYGDAYLDIINNLKGALGDRLIVFSDKLPIAYGAFSQNDQTGVEVAKSAFNKAIKLAKARGYELTPEVEAAALGEYLFACVAAAQGNINKSGILKKRVNLLENKSVGYSDS